MSDVWVCMGSALSLQVTLGRALPRRASVSPTSSSLSASPSPDGGNSPLLDPLPCPFIEHLLSACCILETQQCLGQPRPGLSSATNAEAEECGTPTLQGKVEAGCPLVARLEARDSRRPVACSPKGSHPPFTHPLSAPVTISPTSHREAKVELHRLRNQLDWPAQRGTYLLGTEGRAGCTPSPCSNIVTTRVL